VADHTTPFHGHPNLFGWRFGFQGFVALHSITGILLFLVCLVPLLTVKGGKTHVVFGRAFVVFWLVHLFDGLVNSGQILMTRGFEPTRYLDATKQGFSLYLYVQFAFISSVVMDFLAHGLAALQYKNHMPPRGMRAVMLAMPLSSLVLGLSMTAWGIYRVASSAPPATPNTMEFAVVFIVQVPAYIYLIVKNVSYWAKPTARAWLHGWVTEHQRNMMFCVQVTLYTGLANATMKYAPWLTPFLFGAIDVGFIVWLLLKERAIRKSVLGARLGFAFISMLRTGKNSVDPVALHPADERWILRTYDLDGDGSLDAKELHAILAAQGIDLSEAETERIRKMLDRDDNGRIDRHELGAFLSGWLVNDPSYDDDLALAFRTLDKNGDGRLDTDELRAALTQGPAHDRLTQADVDHVFGRLHAERGGQVEWQEFAEAVESKRRGWTNPWMATSDAEKQKRIHEVAARFPLVHK
jgi:calcium-binding protein CML